MSEERERAVRRQLWLASGLVAAGLVICGLSLHAVVAGGPRHMAQGTPQPQASPPAQNNAPAESKPGGTRPTTPAPEPARPDPEAQKLGAKPALPAAPAEKMAPPIKEKEK